MNQRNDIKSALCGCTLLCLLTSSLFSQAAVPPRLFRAGAATANISPDLGISLNGHFNDRKARHIHDELHARCLVLDNGQTRLAIVVCDSCMIPREIIENAKGLIRQTTALAPEHVLISATHTHTAPTCAGVFQSEPEKEYATFLARRIADGVCRAVNNLAPARIGWGTGHEPNQVFNRRWKMKPGTIPANPFGGTNDLVRMNPPPGSTNLLEPAGPIDPEIPVISVQGVDGHALAVLAVYSLHYVGGGRDDEISADYYGSFAVAIEHLIGAERLDPPFVALLANGTSGDINNINFRTKQIAKPPYEQIRTVAAAVADETFRVYRALEYRDWVPLDARQTDIYLRVRLPSKEEVAAAERLLAKAQGPPLRTLEEVYARETVLMKDHPAEVPLCLQVLRIGDVGIAAIPCEVFAETGLQIKRQSPFKSAFTVELANGYNGYLPTPAQHKLGGYETWRARSSYLELDAAPKIVGALTELFAQLK